MTQDQPGSFGGVLLRSPTINQLIPGLDIFANQRKRDTQTVYQGIKMTMNAKERIGLITSGLQEVLKGNILEDVIEKEGRNLKIYWGMFNPIFFF